VISSDDKEDIADRGNNRFPDFGQHNTGGRRN
jgi:hypothetical protein